MAGCYHFNLWRSSNELSMRMTITLALVLISSALPGVLSAAGRTTFPIAKTLLDSRALALSGASIAEDSWSGGAALNPAAPAGDETKVQVTFARHSLDLWSGLIGGSYRINDSIISGFYFGTFDYGELDYSERGSGLTGETFSAAENMISGYIAGKFAERLAWGASLKYLWGRLEKESAGGVAADLGIIWDVNWEKISLAVAARNLGSQFESYGSEKDYLPTELTVGGCRTLRHLPLKIHAAAIFGRSGEEDWTLDEIPGSPGFGFGIGGEFKVTGENQQQPLFIRLGYRSRGQGLQVGHRLDIISGFTFGIGFAIKQIDVDYAFAPMGALGDIHRFGISGKLSL